jgi:hypothetical protein
MSASNLFDTAVVPTGGKCVVVDMREQPQPAGTLCDYFKGKPLDKNTLCARPGCGRPWREHYPEYKPKRLRGVIQDVCSVCSYPIESDQHLNHCRG